jgi:hypothetical protein
MAFCKSKARIGGGANIIFAAAFHNITTQSGHFRSESRDGYHKIERVTNNSVRVAEDSL